MEKPVSENMNAGAAWKAAERSFSDLAAEYSPYIKSVTASFPERHREDLYQEGLVALSSAYRTFDPETNVPLEAYLKICIRRRIIAAYRVMKRSDETVDIDGSEISDPTDIEEDVVDREFTEDFFRELRTKLTDLEKSVLAEYLSDRTYSQISEKLGISEKKVDNALVRIKNKVRKYFAE